MPLPLGLQALQRLGHCSACLARRSKQPGKHRRIRFGRTVVERLDEVAGESLSARRRSGEGGGRDLGDDGVDRGSRTGCCRRGGRGGCGAGDGRGRRWSRHCRTGVASRARTQRRERDGGGGKRKERAVSVRACGGGHRRPLSIVDHRAVASGEVRFAPFVPRRQPTTIVPHPHPEPRPSSTGTPAAPGRGARVTMVAIRCRQGPFDAAISGSHRRHTHEFGAWATGR